MSLSLTLFVFADAFSTDKIDFQKVSDVIYDALYDIRYYSDNNFTGHRIKEYRTPVAYMIKSSLKAPSIAAEDLRKKIIDF